ncbi:uncharacterized protein LODBEIA_P42680 [Lodderomyces beijingensis]|uniref:MARVEL domain-containing protein n=1 Tax=Lodderomyces beijingensis TaxID=1775926 RepID=A0ABP0ZPH7_9ASCO
MVHNVLFDPPIPEGQRINVGNNTIIESIESIYNLQLFKNLFIMYFTFLLVQYILIYACVPLEEIENRPAMCVIASIYTLIMFAINASILPLCSSTIPTLLSLRCLFCSFILEAVGMSLNITAVIQNLNAGEMFQIEKQRGSAKITRTNVELYVNIFSIGAMVFSILATMSCFGLVVVCERALEYITCKVDRRTIKATRQTQNLISSFSLARLNRSQDKYFAM